MAEEESQAVLRDGQSRIQVDIGSPKKWASVIINGAEDDADSLEDIDVAEESSPDPEAEVGNGVEEAEVGGDKNVKKTTRTAKRGKANGTHAPANNQLDVDKENRGTFDGRKSKRLLRSQAGRDVDGDVDMS